MRTFTHQSKLFGMMRKIITVALLFLTILVGQSSIIFIPAGQASGSTTYNLAASTASSVDGTGGFSFSGSSFTPGVTYYVKVSFDGGTSFYNLDGGTATEGTFLGSGLFQPNAAGIVQIAFQHTRFSNLGAWPGNNGTINLRASDIAQNSFWPGASGSEFTLDLEAPTVSGVTISSNNGTNSNYATTNDIITIVFTSSETLDNTTNVIYGDIAGVSITATGSGTSWSARNTVSTHAEGGATYNITYYDVNGNPGVSAISATNDGSSVTIDKTAATVTASIASNNNTTSLAKIGNIVTLTISSNELLNAAPTITIDGNSVTPNPTIGASSYTATRTMEAGDTQGAIAFIISGVVDRAGNTTSNVTTTSDASSVTFDSVVPTITGLTIASNNNFDSDASTSLATTGDNVTLTFYTSEKSQTPVATIATEGSVESNSNGDLLTWSAVKEMDADDADGTVAFTIDFYDLAGNQGTQATSILTGSNVTFDKTAPTISSVSITSSNSTTSLAKSGDEVSITLASDEALYSLTSVTIAGNTISNTDISALTSTSWKISYNMTPSDGDGAVSFAFTANDLAGNSTTRNTVDDGTSVTYDKTAPTLSTVEIVSNNANTSYAKKDNIVTLTIASSEALTAAPTVYLAGQLATVATTDATNYTATLTMGSTDTQGNIAISIAFNDLAGNAGTPNPHTSTTNSSSVTYDREVPTLSTVTVTSNNTNTDYAKQGDIITLTFVGTENLIASPTVTIATAAANVSGSDANWTATYTMQSGDDQGAIPFTIDFKDIAGNSGIQRTTLSDGSAVVYDKTVPTLSTVSITSNNSNSATLATEGDQITLSIAASENIQMPTVTIAGKSADIASGSNGESVYTFTYTMVWEDAATTAIPFTVDFKDMASNSGTQATTLVNDSDGGVAFDKEDPTLTAVSMSSSNSDNTLAKVNDVVTVSITTSEAIITGVDPTVTIALNTATVTRNSTTSFTAVYTMSSTPNDANYDGFSIPISISNFSDPTGNSGTTVTATIDGSAVTFDKELPTLSDVTIASDNTNSHYAKETDVITLTFSASESIQTPTVKLIGSATDVTVTAGLTASEWTATKTVTSSHTEGTTTFEITFSDLVGNAGAEPVGVKTSGKNVTIDRSAPTISTASIASNNGNGTELAVPGNNIELTVVTNENIAEPTITIATNPADVDMDGEAKNWTGTYTMTANEANGQVAFVISFSDSAGNAGADHSTITNDEDGNNVQFSKTEPELSNIVFVSDNSFNTAYAKDESILTLSFRSGEQLIPNTVLININETSVTASKTLSHNGTYEAWAANYTMTNATEDNGGLGKTIEFTIDYDAINGNSGDQVTATSDGTEVTFDKTDPTATTLTIASNNANDATLCQVTNDVTITFVANEILQTPTILIGGNTATVVQGGTASSWTGTYTMLNSDTEGTVSISVAFVDYSGNSGTTATAILSGSDVTFDRTTPTLSAVSISSNNTYSPARATTGDEITLTITADEALESSPIFTIDGNAVVPTGSVSGTVWTGTYIMQAGDTESTVLIPTVPFTIVFEDLAANAGTDVIATIGGSSVTFDETATDMTGVVVVLDSGSDTGVSSTDKLTNDTTPTFTVTGLALAISDSIYLVIDGAMSGKDKAVSGTLSLTSTTLAEKVLGYSVSVYSMDLTGNVSSLSTAITVKVDTTPWTITTVPNLLESDDMGFENDDDITNITQPKLILSGLPSVPDSIRLFYNIGAGDVLSGAYRMGQGTLDTVMVSSVLSDNDYSFTYIMIDSAGNESSESSGLTVTVDATSPSQPATPDLTSGTDTGVSTSDDITNNTTIGFSVGSLTIGDRLYLKANDVSLDDDVYDSNDIANTTQVITISDAVSAAYTAFSMDAAGNTSAASSSLSVTVDITPPNVSTVEIVLAIDSDSGTKDDDDLTNDYTPEFSVSELTVTDSVYLHVDDVLNKRLKATNATMTFTTDSLSDNTHVISIYARDLAGNLSIVSDKTLTIRVDTQPPTMSASAPDLLVEDDAGFDNTDNKTNKTSPRFELVDLPSVPDSIRLFYDTGTGDVISKAMRMSQGVTDTIQTSSSLGGDTYSFTYVILDSAGNVSNTSSALSLIVDVSPPSVPNAPDLVAGSDFGKSSTDNLTYLATPNLTVAGVLPGYLSSLYVTPVPAIAGDTVLISTEFVSSDPVTFTSSALTTGNYTFFPVASDTAGNTREGADLSVTIDLGIPSTIISFDGDSLVRFGDVQSVATFTFTEEMDDVTNPPTVDVNYPEGTLNDLTAQTLTNVNATTWSYDIPLNTSGLEDIDGMIALTLNSSDLAGNSVPVDSITGLSVLRVDNTTPVFSSFSPDTGAFMNGLNTFGWTLSETIESGSVIFKQKSGPGSDVTIILDATELVAGVHAPGTFTVGDPLLTDGTLYDIIYTSIDTAGNTGLDTIANVSYDITAPIITLTFDQLFSTEDSVVLVTATWDERALPTPTIAVNYGGDISTLDDFSDAAMDPTPGDSTIWTYPITIPGEEVNNGPVLFTITGTDLAENAFDPATLVMVDTLVVDNILPTVTFTYSNISQPTLTNRGKAGDIIDITATFNEPTHLINAPLLNIAYATDSDTNIGANTSSNGDSVWIYRITLLDSAYNTGYITITSDATDRAGNQIETYADTSYNDIFYTDNTLPTFTFLLPDSGSYVNHNLVDYSLSETVKSGSITWTRLSGNIDANSPHIIEFDATEIVGDYPYRGWDLNGWTDSLVSETYYEVKFSATDSSNNQSIDFIETPVYYDTTGSSVTVTFSQLFVSADSTVTITATFNERIKPTPSITLDFAGAFNDITDSLMTIANNDSSIWTLTIDSIPSGIENQGYVGISITAEDLATNVLDSTSILIPDSLYVDNTVTIADFSYINISQEDSIGNVGIGDDVIQITVQMNEPIIVYDPIPALNYTYAGGSGNSVDGVIAQSSSNGDSVWVFQITLQDTVHNDGPLNITLVAKDRSNNDVTNFTNNTLFQVDNNHPADFVVGATTVFGNNAVQGWINGTTDSIGVVIPIQTNSEDSTLFLGGYTKIQFYNLTRGVAWVTVGTQDSLTQAGTDEIFYRTIQEIEATLSPGSALILGDSLEIRASITDRNGNLTHGTASTQKLVYDPVGPVVGQINGGNMFTADTLYSNDTLSIKWSAFVDEGDDASGFDQYQLAFEKLGSDSLEDFYGWEQVALPTVPLEYGLFLEHNEKYIGHIRGFDIAGNLSDTLVTDTLVRYNSKPTIATLIDAALDEDISWTETISLTDPDLFVMQSDSFTYKAITTRLVGNAATDSVTIDSSGVLAWTPTQNDTGTYEIQVIATDAYAFADTFKLPLVVTAVNDTPVVDILSPDNNLEWVEDDTATVKINLTSYL
ncbi:MAG TPA: hypothetical protein EYQ40_10660, partial [Candidatus Marinimicrobia bacterium]|nr:hypothetical protein [Candidatus Neomarinimicrobiota bacterium]